MASDIRYSMEYRKTKNFYTGIVIVDDDKISHINLCMAFTKEQSINMVKTHILKGLSAGNTVRWNKGKNSEVTMFKDVEYDDPYPEMSEYVTKFTMTVIKGNATRHHVKRTRNPLYSDNPECEFCYKKVTKLYNDHLEDKEKTPVKVCAKCRKTLKITHEFMSETQKELTV